MGIIQQIIYSIRSRRQEQKSNVSEDIDEYIKNEKMKNKIAYIKEWEKADFFSRGNINE